MARLLLTAGALLPYWRLLSFSAIVVTDGVFSSDLYNGELPGRMLVADLIRNGQWPLWTSQICSGYPLAGTPSDPLGLALFTLLPPAPALDLLLIVHVLVAAHGTYWLARRMGAEQPAAVLAGIAFAGCGHIVYQLVHLSILTTIVWLPVGLALIDRLFTPGESRSRSANGALLGLVFANQVLAGYPQSAYICGLVYVAFAIFRALSNRAALGSPRAWLGGLAVAAAALAIGTVAGAVVFLPLAELAGASDRPGTVTVRWATFTSFWPRDFFTFFVPYINGDASDLTYAGPHATFWEDYGYAGAATALLAFYGAARERRRPLVGFLILTTIIAFSFTLGNRTPFYPVAHTLIPGMNVFRGPTRFLVVVDLGLVLLAAIGLTRLRADLERRWSGSRLPRAVPPAICVITAIDLLIVQPRQMPTVRASEWLAPPPTVSVVRGGTGTPRTFTPHHRDIHRETHARNRGWANLEAYYTLRDLLEPNLGVYWNVPSADCYVGLPPRWYTSVWGYHYFEASLMSEAAFQRFKEQTLDIRPRFHNLLRTYGVSHVLSPFPGEHQGLTLVARQPAAYVYKVEGSARVRVVRAARRTPTEGQAALFLGEPGFDPDREVMLMDAPDSIRPTVDTAGEGTLDGARAAITGEGPRDLTIEASTPQDAFLVLADTFYPGWRAQVDGVDTPIYRANISLRAVALPKGRHTVRFTYNSAPFFLGLKISIAALALLCAWLAVAAARTRAHA